MRKLTWLQTRFTLWTLLVGVIILAALAAITLNLRAVSEHRARLYRTLTLEVGETAMNYILAQDDFPARRTMIIGSIAFIGALLIGIVLLLQRLDNTNRRLQQEEQLKSEMISVITHNANHFLAVIKGRIDLLGMKQDNGAPVTDLRKDLDMMGEGALSLSRLIDNLNKNELLSRGRMSVWLEPVDLSGLIQAVITGFAGLQASGQVQVHFTAPPEARVQADRHLLEQVLMNLIHNAIKFSRSGGTVQVWLERTGGAFRVFIRDQGPGIPADQWERVFTPFVRLLPATRGAGLGLSNARQIIRLLGGELAVQASEPGQGTTFMFTLSAAPVAVKEPED